MGQMIPQINLVNAGIYLTTKSMFSLFIPHCLVAETANYMPNIHLPPYFLVAKIPILLGMLGWSAMGHFPGFLASRQ